MSSKATLRTVLSSAVLVSALLGALGASEVSAVGSSPGSEAILDYAVATPGGAWCTDPVSEAAKVARLQPPLTVEGWFRSEGPGVFFALSDVTHVGVSLSLGAGGQVGLRAGAEVTTLPGIAVAPRVWTHFALELGPGRAQLLLWDAGIGERSAAVATLVRVRSGARLCFGGEAGKPGFPGLIDEARLFHTRLAGDTVAAWRHRRLGPSHPGADRVLAAWPFSAGRGGTEAGTGRLGPLRTPQPDWRALPALAYGPILRSVGSRSARFLFAARSGDGRDVPWQAGVEVVAEGEAQRRIAVPSSRVDASTDFVAHLRLDDLKPQTRYRYVPLIDGRQGAAGEALSFRTFPDLEGRNADFTVVFLADQHTTDTPTANALNAFDAAASAEPLFWAQLGDVIPGSLDGRTVEHKRDAEMLRGLWRRNFGSWDLPQTRFLRRYSLGLATISDHEISDNFNLNWHHQEYGSAASRAAATLGDRVQQYDRSVSSWWNHWGWGPDFEDRLGMLARGDRGESVMGTPYAVPGHYHALAPYPYVEFFVLDTTSYRGDPYQTRDRDRHANRDTDHSRYAWDPGDNSLSVFGDRSHGATETTDRVRSWLGPTQKAAFLAALRNSTARILVVAAGYPLHSVKFQDSDRYWEGRESGLDFATELDEILAAIESTGKLVLWVHGDGHSPALVKLRRNLYQFQVGPTLLAGGGTGHRPLRIPNGTFSPGDVLGGGRLLAGHQPDISPRDPIDDVFRGGLDKFEGFLRLYFHPGQEALRSTAALGVKRRTASSVEVAAATNPARNRAGEEAVGLVARLRIRGETFYAVVTAYRFAEGRAVFEFDRPVVSADPDDFQLLVDAEPWVEARWFDAAGREWRDFATVVRQEP
ncbi:MAG TPA: alkaline phosphatase D family protein [Vicinamibacteria bacterium]|nr:alkaline phosphatase D family protein [Vicinamibacteria bacterium]